MIGLTGQLVECVKRRQKESRDLCGWIGQSNVERSKTPSHKVLVLLDVAAERRVLACVLERKHAWTNKKLYLVSVTLCCSF